MSVKFLICSYYDPPGAQNEGKLGKNTYNCVDRTTEYIMSPNLQRLSV